MSVKVIGKHEKDSRACRDALALTLNEMMAEDKSIVYVDCDLMGCINTKMLRKNYPDRAFEAGIAEANGAGVAAGLAAAGKKVFFHSFGTFSSRRCYDQIYMSAAYAGLPVHVLGSDAGPLCQAHRPQRENQGCRRHRQPAGRGGFHQSGGFPSGHQPHREGREGHGKIKGGYYGNAA